MRVTNMEMFLEKARNVHGEKYDYSSTVYGKMSDVVTIICPKHGEFKQKMSTHLQGHGCRECDNERKRNQPTRLTTEQFVERAKKIHSDYCYDYSLVRYVDYVTSVDVICKDHGLFKVRPGNHLNGKGCRECGKLKISKKLGKDTEWFLSRVAEVHGDTYDCSRVVYVRSNVKVDMICKEHGLFKTTPNNLLCGKGCPACADSGFQKDKPAVVYVIDAGEFTGYGITSEPKIRLSNHKRNLKRAGFEMKDVYISSEILGKDAKEIEDRIAKLFPKMEVPVSAEGFKRESTPASFADVVRFVELELSNLMFCTQPNSIVKFTA